MTEQQGLGTQIVTQVGIIVRDIDKTIDQYMQVFGLSERPNVIVSGALEEAETALRGQPTSARAKLAFIPMGQVTIELIEPDGNPSTWQEHLDTRGQSVHHIAFQIQGTDQVVAQLNTQGVPTIQQGKYTGGMYSYMDSNEKLGVMLELLENFKK